MDDTICSLHWNEMDLMLDNGYQASPLCLSTSNGSVRINLFTKGIIVHETMSLPCCGRGKTPVAKLRAASLFISS